MPDQKKLARVSSQLMRIFGNSLYWIGIRGQVCILSYHRILEHADPLLETEPDLKTFTWQMETLAASFNVLPLCEAVAAIRENRVPPLAICITFDDGYRSTYELALPILKRLGLPATVFATTGFLDEGAMWNDRIVEAVRSLPDGEIDLQTFGVGVHDLRGSRARQEIVRQINDECKYLHSEQRLDFVEKLEKLVGSLPVYQLMLTREMIASLARQGVEIGGHTVTHPILTKLSDDAAFYELAENKRVLEEITGKPLRFFAYPNGIFGLDFDHRHVQMVEAAGFSAAFTTALGAASKYNDVFQLPRRRPWDATPFMFSLRLLSWLGKVPKERSQNGDGNDLVDGRVRRKTALLIAFHYPPQAESSGVQRTLSFSKYLHEQNWSANVLSANSIAYERKNSSQLENVPGFVSVKRAWSLDAKRHLSFFKRYPEAIALPDRWVSWWLFAVPLGWSIIRRKKIQVIWSTYPIATAHLIGLTLKFLTGKPWIADFRDPMWQDDYPESKWQRKVFLWIEQRTIKYCDAAVFTTQSARNTYVQRYFKIAKEKFHIIENGYDEDAFMDVLGEGVTAARLSEEQITLVHSGALYSEGRDPSQFFAAIAELKRCGTVDAIKLRVVLRAPSNEEHFRSMVRLFQVEDIVFVEPHLPYQLALREMLAADGLLVFQGSSFNTQVPAKIYEYFRARKPVFGMVDPEGETAKVLVNAGFKNIANMTSVDEISKNFNVFLEQIRTGLAYVATDEIISSSSRRHRTGQLTQLFNRICNKKSR